MPISQAYAQSADPPENLGGDAAQFISDDGSVVAGRIDTGGFLYNVFRWTPGTGPTNIGTISPGSHFLSGMSNDGGVLTGYASTVGGDRGWVWTSGGGISSLGTLGGGMSRAYGISGDGTVIVGESENGGADVHAFRWTSGGGMIDMGTLGGTSSKANGISQNGTYIVGTSQIAGNASYNAFYWSQGSGMVDIGNLGGTDTYATFITNNGNIIYGDGSLPGDTMYHAFRWTSGTGIVDLGTLGGDHSNIYHMSIDGSAVIGSSNLAGNVLYGAFRWTEADGMVNLGTLGGDNAYAEAMSSDGNIVYGSSDIAGNATTHVFRWTPEDGIQDLSTLISETGVDMTGIVLKSAWRTTPDGQYIVGQADFGAGNTSFLVRYNADTGTAGVTTGDAQVESAQDLAQTQQASAIGTRSASNILLGSLSSIRNTNNTSTGAMFGSALGYAGGEYTRERFTLLGGFGYGTQDYEGAELHAAPIFAAALRYSFADMDTQNVIPFIEAGGSLSPFQDVTFSRSYANGAGTATGKGTTETTQGLWYARAGTAWNVTEADQLTAFGEYGQQYLSFDAYTEADRASNPFPARIDNGTSKMDVARAGGSWSHEINDRFNVTVSGAIARSFNVDADLRATVAGVGTVEADGEQFTWSEYGAKLETRLTDSTSLNLLVNGTAGGSHIDNSTHGGVSVSYRF